MKPVAAINNPCHESWEKMNPEEQGRHCDQCCKIVVDFTKMSNKAIAKYLEQRTEQKVCGRFKVEQVRELPKAKIRFNFQIKRFAAAVLLAFGSFLFHSCSSARPHQPEVMGDVAYIPDSTQIVKHEKQDSTLVHADTTKNVLIPDDKTVYIMGDVAYNPELDSVAPKCTHDKPENK